MRFTTRDLFWLTLLVAVCCVNWSLHRHAVRLQAENDELTRAWSASIKDHDSKPVQVLSKSAAQPSESVRQKLPPTYVEPEPGTWDGVPDAGAGDGL
jgi:hypothetical protein